MVKGSPSSLTNSARSVAADPLAWIAAFDRRFVDKSIGPFRSWTGGAIVTDLFPEFFGRAWARLNDHLASAESEWHTVVQEWRAAARQGTSRPGTAKLMHPWRLMRLLKGVAEAMHAEECGRAAESGGGELVDRSRAARRLEEALLAQTIERLAYAPFAGHVLRRFCPTPPTRKRARNT